MPIHRINRKDWEARVITMRAARRLADRLESIAQDAAEPTNETQEAQVLNEERLDQSFRTLFASLTALLESLPNAEKSGR